MINVPPSQKAETQSSNALVGNPSYRHWQQDNGGRSFWAWYGMYSMFNNVMDVVIMTRGHHDHTTVTMIDMDETGGDK